MWRRGSYGQLHPGVVGNRRRLIGQSRSPAHGTYQPDRERQPNLDRVINLQTIDVFAAFMAGLVAAVLFGSAVPIYRAR